MPGGSVIGAEWYLQGCKVVGVPEGSCRGRGKVQSTRGSQNSRQASSANF